MAYDKNKVFETAKEAIIKHKLFFIDDIIAFLPIAKSTFYEWKMEQSDDLKALLEKNRTELKVSMRSKWYTSNAPALQMALMKLIATPEELRKLSMNHQVTEETEKPIFKQIDLDVITDNSAE
jgi:pantothenate kinase-related protein Tda10